MIIQKLPFALQKKGAQLLHQQCSLWGQDVRRLEGNLLLQQNFKRVRPPKSVSGCSQYTLRLESGLLLRLWGFGFFIGEGEGVYVNRYNFTPRHVVMPEDVWETKYFARAPYSQDYELFALGLRTIIKVEETVLRHAGLPYRQRCLSLLEKAFFEPYAFLAEWRALERQVTRFAQVASRHAARTQYPCFAQLA